MGFAWSVPASSKENNRAKTNEGGRRIIGRGGPKTVFGKGFYGMFSPPLSFPPPLCFSLIKRSCPCFSGGFLSRGRLVNPSHVLKG